MLHYARSWRSARFAVALVRAATLAAVFSATAARADGTWTSISDSASWDDSGNWSGGTVADGANATATFGPVTLSTDSAFINLDSPRTIGHLVFPTSSYFVDEDDNGSVNWYLDNGGTAENVLTLAGSSPSIDTAKRLEINAVIGGTDGLIKSGGGTLILKMANTYTGTTTVTAGSITAAALGSLGTGEVVVSGSGSEVSLNAQGSWANAFTLGNSTRLMAGAGSGKTSTVSGITLTGNATLASFNGSILEVAGAITGNYGITIGNFSPTNASTSFTGSSANTYTGATTVNSSNLILAKTAGVTAIAGDLTLGNSSNTVTVRLDSSHQIADTSAVVLTKNSTLNLNGQTETIGSLASTHPTAFVTLGSGALTVGANDTSTTFQGVISGTGSLTKIGTGTLTLSGANAYTGGTTVTAGTLTLDSPNPLQNATGTLTIAGGTLSSTVGNSTIGSDLTFTSGAIAPGGTNAGRLTLETGKTFAMSGGTLTLTLGTSFDTIYSNGSGTLALTGGIIALDTSGAGFSYGSTYQVFNGFNSASFGSLTLAGYDTTNYTASFSNSGQLSFGASAVPEPATSAILGGLGALAFAAWRRRARRGPLVAPTT